MCVQQVVWEKLDAIDGDTVFVSSTLKLPGGCSPSSQNLSLLNSIATSLEICTGCL